MTPVELRRLLEAALEIGCAPCSAFFERDDFGDWIIDGRVDADKVVALVARGLEQENAELRQQIAYMRRSGDTDY